MARELPRRVVAVDAMSDEDFARHIKWAHPALRPRNWRNGHKAPPASIEDHLADHRAHPAAHVHVRVVAADYAEPEYEPRAELKHEYIGDVTGVRRDAGLAV